jgi:hypothetical protein
MHRARAVSGVSSRAAAREMPRDAAPGAIATRDDARRADARSGFGILSSRRFVPDARNDAMRCDARVRRDVTTPVEWM